MGHFDRLNVAFFTKAAVWVNENTSFELAKDVESQTFPWTEEGVEQVKAWLEEKLAERGSQPYSIPYPAPQAE